MNSISTHILSQRMTIICKLVLKGHSDFDSHPLTEDDFMGVYPVVAHGISTHILSQRMTGMPLPGSMDSHNFDSHPLTEDDGHRI